MKRKNHYTVLGVPRDESSEGIRAAYLRCVKALHPDHAGEASTQAFREVQQAYDVLSDPIRRRSYDSQLDRKRPARRWQAEPLTPHHPVEPLIPEPPIAALDPLGPASFFNHLFDRFAADPTPIGAPSAPPPEIIGLDVALSVEQAARGGDFTFGIPVRETCPVCGGTGVSWPFSCDTCDQRGWIASERALRLRVPPGIRHGTVVHLCLEPRGGAVLRVRLLTDRRMRAPPIW